MDNIFATIGLVIVLFLTIALPIIIHVQEKTAAKERNLKLEIELDDEKRKNKKLQSELTKSEKETGILKNKVSDLEKKVSELATKNSTLTNSLNSAKANYEVSLSAYLDTDSESNNEDSPYVLDTAKLQAKIEDLEIAVSSWKANYKRQTHKLMRIKSAHPDINITPDEVYEYTEEEIDEWYKAFIKDTQKRKRCFLSTKISANPLLGDVSELLSIHCDPKAIFKSIYNGAWNRVRETFLRVKVLHVDAVIDSGDKVYATTLNDCECEDFLRRRRPCKHMIYLAYVIGYLQLNKDLIEETESDSIRRLSEQHKRYADEKKELEKIKKEIHKLELQKEALSSLS